MLESQKDHESTRYSAWLDASPNSERVPLGIMLPAPVDQDQ